MALSRQGVNFLRSAKMTRAGRKVNKSVQTGQKLYKTYHMVKDGKVDMQMLHQKAHVAAPKILRSRIDPTINKVNRAVNVAETILKNGQRMFDRNRQQQNPNSLALPKGDAGGITF